MGVSRRRLMGQLAGFTALAITDRAAQGKSNAASGVHAGALVAQHPSLPPGALSITLGFKDGSRLVFEQSKAADAGDYVGKFVHQKCAIQRQSVWTVFFRPDADGSREEIVVERGKMWLAPGEAATHQLEPYTARISKGETEIARIVVPKHWWGARWRWQSAPRPIRRTLADLVKMKAIAPLNRSMLYGATPMRQVYRWSGPMGTGGLIASAMGAGGDRQEIGPITDVQGSYLLEGNPEAHESMLAQAEAQGSWCIYFRDERTNALIDRIQHRLASFDGRSSTVIPSAGKSIIDAKGTMDPDYFDATPDHQTSPAFVPWLLTDDPYFYEGAEAAANFAVIYNWYGAMNASPRGPINGVVEFGQPRSWAWGARDLFRMAAFAFDTPPSWLKPKSYFRALLEDNLIFVSQYMQSPAAIHRIFRAFPRADVGCSWMDAFMMSTLGWVGWSGFFPEWKPFVDWFGYCIVAKCDGLSGWDRRWPAPYYPQPFDNRTAGTYVPATGLVPDTRYDAGTARDWREMFQWYVRDVLQNPKASPDQRIDPSRWTEPNHIYENGRDTPYRGGANGAPSGPHYHIQLRGALASAVNAGVPGGRAAHDFLHARMPDICASYHTPGNYKWAIDAVS